MIFGPLRTIAIWCHVLTAIVVLPASDPMISFPLLPSAPPMASPSVVPRENKYPVMPRASTGSPFQNQSSAVYDDGRRGTDAVMRPPAKWAARFTREPENRGDSGPGR